MNFVQRLKIWFFSVPEGKDGNRSFRDVILWWEIRRVPYNLIVGSVGLCSVILFYVFIGASHKLRPGEDAVEPLALIAAPFLLNLAYTAGWVVEALLGKAWATHDEPIASRMLRFGLGISLVFVLIPSIFWGVYLLLLVLGVAK